MRAVGADVRGALPQRLRPPAVPQQDARGPRAPDHRERDDAALLRGQGARHDGLLLLQAQSPTRRTTNHFQRAPPEGAGGGSLLQYSHGWM